MATYYVSLSGNDSNPGTEGSPFRTVYKACTAATLFGDSIIIGPGTFSETSICSVRTGVSITGSGKESTTITSSYNLYPLFNLVSSTEGTAGDQTLSNFKIDGNEIIRSAIYVYKRSNVKILYVDIIDCTANGIRFLGGGTYAGGWDGNAGTPPATFETGNEIAYCTITDCSDGSLNNHGNITIGSQDGILIHDCIFTQKGNPDGQNADILSGWGTHFKNLKFYNNKSYKNVVQKLGWNFHIEIGCTWGGNEVYNNEFYNGTIFDIGAWFNVKGDEDYAWNIHHNIMITERQVSTTEKTTSWGVVFEGTNEDSLFHHNYVKNFQNPVAQTLNQTPRHQNNIRVYNNIFEDIGTSNNHWGWFATITTELLNENDEIIAGDMPISNCYYYNNTMIGKLAQGGIFVTAASDDITGIYVSNNIIKSTIGYGWLTIWHSNDLFGTISNVYVRNNDIYDNTNNNSIYYNNGSSITNLVQTDNIHVDPIFVSSTNFHLQSNSTLIDAGLDVGLTSDYDGVYIPQGSAPDIGAYEFLIEDYGVHFVNTTLNKLTTFPTVTIGTQTWMARNWDWKTNGAVFPASNEDYVNEYGTLFTWDQAVAIGNSVPGWRLPTLDEFIYLQNFVGQSDGAGYLKESGTTHWITNTEATNSTGFTAIGSGTGSDIKLSFRMWSSTESILDPTNYTYTFLLTDNSNVITSITYAKINYASIRLIKE